MSNAAAPISVVMPVYNGERHVGESIDSILAQTHSDFELIIVDDGSIDRTPEILEAYRKKDPRIKIITNEKNMGVIISRNRALNASSGRLIANQDADDIARPDRLMTQMRYMSEHPECGLLGARAEIIDGEGRRTGMYKHPRSHVIISAHMCFASQFVNSSVMMRRDAIKAVGQYDETMLHAEDYDLLSRMARGFRSANLPFVLESWRSGGSTSDKRRIQMSCARKVGRDHMAGILSARSLRNHEKLLVILALPFVYVRHYLYRDISETRAGRAVKTIAAMRGKHGVIYKAMLLLPVTLRMIFKGVARSCRQR